MSHGTKIVPSRDALRALRTLAFSPQAAFVAATGSVCGLVAIHHQQRGKVRLAEKILKTKRTIHILSQGRGNAQATRMFEAAEKGEDFTLHHGRPKKSRRTRRFATNAAVKPLEETFESRPLSPDVDIVKEESSEQGSPQTLAEEAHEFKPWIDYGDLVKERLPEQVSPQWREARLDPLEDDLERTQDDVDQKNQLSPSVNSELNHVTRSSKNSRIYGNKYLGSLASLKPQKFDSIPGTWSKTVEEAKKRLRERWAQQQHSLSNETDLGLDESIPSIEQKYTDLNPVPLIPTIPLQGAGINTSLGLSTEESLFFNFVFDRPMPDSIFETNVFKSLQPWSASLAPETKSVEGNETEQRSPESNTLSSPGPEQLIGTDVTKSPDSDFTSRYEKSFIFKSFDDMDRTERYFAAFNSIARAFQTGGKLAAMEMLEHHLNLHYSSARSFHLEGFRSIRIESVQVTILSVVFVMDAVIHLRRSKVECSTTITTSTTDGSSASWHFVTSTSSTHILAVTLVLLPSPSTQSRMVHYII
jgi:hypothetical protein